MPGWHQATKALRESGRFRTLGIIQEQHPDRCRLFMQWKQMDWPVLVDSLNRLGVSVVPITLAIDEHGIVRMIDPRPDRIEKEFLERTFDPPAKPARSAVVEPNDADEQVLSRDSSRLDRAVKLYQQQLQESPNNGATHFRLGVAHRMRYDSDRPQPNDFQRAVHHWQRALEIDPNQYIWRRRIQQYGPRLIKPYPFYDWVATARTEIEDRGEIPVALSVEPGSAEFAKPARQFAVSSGPEPEPDPQGRIHRDKKGFVLIETTVVPGRIAPGGSARVHLVLRPNQAIKAHWNNEARDGVLWINPPDGWRVDSRHRTISRSPEPVSLEDRRVEFEVQCPQDARPGRVSIPAYALCYVCEDVKGQCLYRRQDIDIVIEVVSSSP